MVFSRYRRTATSQSGSATVEQIGLILMLALALAILVGAYLAGIGGSTDRGLAQRLANRIACGPREPGVCRQHPAVSAYGWDLARVLRASVPTPTAKVGPGGALSVPVDFRYCQRPSCAIPGRPGLTTANRRLTLFTEVEQLPGKDSWQVTYWAYRPSLGWEASVRTIGRAEITAATGTRVLLKDNPRLVPLEILPGRNHYRLPKGEEPPWSWRVGKKFPGWST